MTLRVLIKGHLFGPFPPSLVYDHIAEGTLLSFNTPGPGPKVLMVCSNRPLWT